MEDVQDDSALKFSPAAEAHLDALEVVPVKPRCKKCHGEGRLRSVACDHEGCYGDCGRTIECKKCEGTGEEGGKRAVEVSESLVGQLGVKLTNLEESVSGVMGELRLTRQLYVRSIQERVELKDELNTMPPMDVDVLRKFFAYSLRAVTRYAILAKEEKAFLTEADYTALRNWALKGE